MDVPLLPCSLSLSLCSNLHHPRLSGLICGNTGRRIHGGVYAYVVSTAASQPASETARATRGREGGGPLAIVDTVVHAVELHGSDSTVAQLGGEEPAQEAEEDGARA